VHYHVIESRMPGHTLRLEAASGLFSHDRVDDGTRLLLENLPASQPATVLDMGCGYGALSLPLAAAHPHARFTLVDRDLLAVHCAQRNAAALKFSNVTAHGSLGYRDVKDGPFDWVLCNVPARIGQAGVAYLMEEGATRLTPSGELRVVVIRDLCAVVEQVAAQRGWPLIHVARGPRHDIYALKPCGTPAPNHEDLYARDDVTLNVDGQPLTLHRPHDINEDPVHQRVGLPLLVECLPRKAARVLCVRAGYGAAAVVMARRGARVTVADRDLMASTFSRINARRHGFSVDTVDHVWPGQPLAQQRFDLVVGEVHPQEDVDLVNANILDTLALVAPGGQALWLMLQRAAKQAPAVGHLLAQRAPFCVWRATPTPPRARKR
jgi:16S rRNA (guanine1207-N2)-methyltransferase